MMGVIGHTNCVFEVFLAHPPTSPHLIPSLLHIESADRTMKPRLITHSVPETFAFRFVPTLVLRAYITAEEGHSPLNPPGNQPGSPFVGTPLLRTPKARAQSFPWSRGSSIIISDHLDTAGWKAISYGNWPRSADKPTFWPHPLRTYI